MHPMFNEEAREGLRDMLLMVDPADSQVYVCNTSADVLLLFIDPDRYFPAQFLEMAERHQTTTRFMRMDVLYASDVDPHTATYLPRGGRQYESMVSVPTWMHTSLSTQSAARTLETWENSFAGDTVSLSKLFSAGRCTPVYAASSKPFGTRKASSYLFRTNKRDLALDGPSLRTLDAMRLDVRLPKQHPNPTQGTPRLGVINDADDIIGVLSLNRTGGEMRSRDGRVLYHPSVAACWFTKEECKSLLASPTLHDPTNGFPMNYGVTQLAAAKTWFVGCEQAKKAVSGLRWLGAPDEEIDARFMQVRPRVLAWLHADMLQSAEELLAQVYSLDNVEEYRLDNMINQARKLAELYEGLCSCATEPLDSGSLDELLEFFHQEV